MTEMAYNLSVIVLVLVIATCLASIVFYPTDFTIAFAICIIGTILLFTID